MASNTTFNPHNKNEFDKNKLNKDAQGMQATATAGTTTIIDYTISNDYLVCESNVLVKGAAQGDKVSFQVLMGETVLNQFITDWYINPDSTLQSIPKANYPAKLIAGLTLRVLYTSVGEANVWIAINYNFEKVLL